MAAKKRKNGEGTWGKKNIKGTEYQYFKDSSGKYFYGRTIKEVKEKKAKYDKTKITNKTTFKQYMLWYLKNIHKNTVEKTTYTSYMTIAKTIVDSKYYNIGRVQLDAITKKKNFIQEYITEITKHYALNTIKGQWNVIKVCIGYAEKNGYIEKGILDDIKLPKESNCGHSTKLIPFLSKNDADKLYKEVHSCYSNGKPRYSSTGWSVLLLIHTGLRIGELRALRWNDVDLEKKTLRVDESIGRYKEDEDESEYSLYTKNPKNQTSNRTIPLDSVAIEMIKNFEKINPDHSDTDFVCLTKYKNIINYQTISRKADVMLMRIGSEVAHINVHALRHTFGSILYEQGAPMKTISKLLGHKNISTTMNIYVDVNDNSLVDSVNLLEPDAKKDMKD